MTTDNTEAPKISLEDIEHEISHVAYMTGDRFLSHAEATESNDKRGPVLYASHTTICMVTMKNGYLVVGQATPASPENFDRAIGRKLAYEKCIQQIWPILGYVLREQLHKAA